MLAGMDVKLQNNSSTDVVYAYVTGLALQKNNARVLLQANGEDLYYPEEPKSLLSPLQMDCAIPLGPPGTVVIVKIPQMAGGRIWFSRKDKLTFLLNPPGPALVEPSVLNPSDPNRHVDFSFAEFTLNSDQLFANISYVDFVPRLPIALTLEDANGTQHVSGMASDGLEIVCERLRAQKDKDGKPWDKLIVTKNGRPLRALSPMHGTAVHAKFDGYFEPAVEEVWSKYNLELGKDRIEINSQSSHGLLRGGVNDSGELEIGGEKFAKPTTADIMGCNSGPFATGSSPKRNAIIPRLAAAFARGAILETSKHPSEPATFYRRDPANHYARIVHEVNLDGKGYAFAYDDVQPDGGADQSGKVNAGRPRVFTVSVGGKNVYVGERLP